MAKGKLSDVIVPEIFNPYFIQRLAVISAIRSSGIVQQIAGIEVPATGKLLNLPFWNDLTGVAEVLDDNGNLTEDKITAADDVAAIHTRGKLWSMNMLVKAFTGEDPMRVIADLAADFWSRQEQALLLATLKGVFASASMSGNLLDISAAEGNAGIITKNTLTDAISVLGDAGQRLTGIICHSATMYDLAKKSMLDPKLLVNGADPAPEKQSYLGRLLIADDSSPMETVDPGETDPYVVYTTYLFGAGSVGYAEGELDHMTETDFDIKSGDDQLALRRKFIMHPRGVKWTPGPSVPAKPTPSDAELSVGTNWTRAWNNKNIHIVAFKHRIGDLA
ncbi:MAG: major capsid protein [Treponema sp.]|jgi:hypothetical protein|nr:major capsid protein [Treponema sp.]